MIVTQNSVILNLFNANYDAVLEILELDAVQLSITLEELPLVFKTLKPEGVWFSHIEGIQDKETADRVIRCIEAWK